MRLLVLVIGSSQLADVGAAVVAGRTRPGGSLAAEMTARHRACPLCPCRPVAGAPDPRSGVGPVPRTLLNAVAPIGVICVSSWVAGGLLALAVMPSRRHLAQAPVGAGPRDLACVWAS